MAIRQGMSPYCMGWQQAKGAQRAVANTGNFDLIDAAERAVRQYAKAMLADPRKIGAMTASCPQYASEIHQLMQGSSTPKTISDPAHDSDAMRRWVGTLTDDDALELEKALKERKAAVKKKPKA
ncbi:MAG TPA: hypothetical protein VIQ05_23280 [Tardiphaga sp.]